MSKTTKKATKKTSSTSKKSSKPESFSAEQGSNQPLFYKNPVPLSPERHKEAGILPEASYDFAQASNSVPITIQEFAEVAKYYPIVFSNEENPTPLAVLGFENEQNLFLDKKGNWEENIYIPAYVRRYPFAFMESQDPGKFILCVDEDSQHFSKRCPKTKGKRFFEDGEQTAFTEAALKFCSQYHQHHQLTLEYARSLNEKKLLTQREASITLENQEKIALAGFFSLGEKPFIELDPSILPDWHKKGWLGLTYYVLLSSSNWGGLAKRYEHTPKAKKAKKTTTKK